MKKKVFIAVSLLCAAFATKSNANTYTCTQTNTKPWGCKTVAETSEGGNYNLTCSDPGSTTCQFSDGTCPKTITWQQANSLVIAQINAGALHGTITIADGSTITWNGENESNFTYDVIELK